jgi:hypothetical protein
MIILFSLCASVIALAIHPPLFDPLLRTFDFERGTDGVIFALLVAVGILFFLYPRAQTTADTTERSVRPAGRDPGRGRSAPAGGDPDRDPA